MGRGLEGSPCSNELLPIIGWYNVSKLAFWILMKSRCVDSNLMRITPTFSFNHTELCVYHSKTNTHHWASETLPLLPWNPYREHINIFFSSGEEAKKYDDGGVKDMCPLDSVISFVDSEVYRRELKPKKKKNNNSNKNL